MAPSCKASSVKVKISRMSDAGYSLLVEGYIENQRTNMVINIGASQTIVSPRIVPAWRIRSAIDKYELLTATGETFDIHGKTTLRMRLGSQQVVQETLVADIANDVILGLNFIKQHGIVVDALARILRMGKESLVMLSPLYKGNQSLTSKSGSCNFCSFGCSWKP